METLKEITQDRIDTILTIMLWHVYLRKRTVFIPLVAQTDDGFYMDIDPVSVLDDKDRQGIVNAVEAVIAKGNPRVATPTRASFPVPVVLKHANVKSWSTFEKSASCWEISKNDLSFRLCFQHKNPTGGWEDDPTHTKTFSGESTISEIAKAVADEIAEVIQRG